ncbi:MAG: endonuclease/exonuclease/phosphatase family protein [Planctomycetes bacterium]|nr:endonuclease/exonuclease/phosphatase family protein [Planctomycetota bacterium]
MRLLTYNIHKGIGGRDRRYRLERIVRVLEHEQPDIICLQEVDRHLDRSRFDDQPRLLAEHFNLPARMFQLNHHVATGGYGNLLLSRWPFGRHHQTSLRYRAKKNRGAQVAEVLTPSGPLRLVNWHLGLAEAERQWQAHTLLAHPAYTEIQPAATLVVGDFNDWRDALKPLFAAQGLRSLTSPPSRFRTFPAWMAVGALDKVYACPRISLERSHVVASRLARVASDHLPLVVDFELSGNSL